MRLKLISVFLAAVLCLALCGCDMFATNTAELLSPPELSGILRLLRRRSLKMPAANTP